MPAISLPANYVLSVTADTLSSGIVFHLADVPGGGPSTDSASLSAGQSTTFGPYTAPARFEVVSYGGALTTSMAPVDYSLVAGAAASLTLSPAAAGANVSEVTLTVKDAAGAAIAGVFIFDVWLSDAATGAGLTAVTSSGTVTAKAASGVVLSTYTAKKALRVQTLATGVFILEITDSAKTGFYVCATLPSTGVTKVSSQLVTASYGA